MKVAVFFDDLRPTAGGGFTFQEEIHGELIRLEASQHEFIIYSREPSEAKNPRLRYVRSRSPRWIKLQHWMATAFAGAVFMARTLGLRGWFARSLRREGVDFVWFVTPAWVPTDLPYLYTVWDLQHRVQPWFPEMSEGARWEFRERQYREVLGRCVAVIAPNQAGREEISRYYGLPPERILTLAHPTPGFALTAPATSPTVRTRFNLGKGPFLLYPAQFWAHKNHVLALRALQKLKAEGSSYTLVCVGSDYGNQAHVKRMARELGVDAEVSFPGFVERADLVALYREAFALLYVSFCGPENIPPLEAFALGCPVIAAAVDGAREQLGEAALLVAPTDPESVVSAIRRLEVESRLKEGLIAAGLARAQRWTAAEYVRAVISFLDSFAPIRQTWGECGGVPEPD